MEESKTENQPQKTQKLNTDSFESEFTDEEEEEQKDQNNTLYDLLNVPRSATIDEIVIEFLFKCINQKKQYKVLALKLHPDKNQGTEEAKENFQKLNEAYQILSDPKKRKIYDDTGLIEDGNMDDFEAAYNFFRSMYKKVEPEDILNFEAKYKNSQEEIDDLIDFYNKNKGDVTLLLEEIILSQNSDIDRFLQIYDKLIQEEKIKSNKKFDQTRKQIKLLKIEKPKKNQRNKQQQQNFQDLSQQILTKYVNTNPNVFLEQLASKYSDPKKKKKSGKQQKDLEEEEDNIIPKKRKAKHVK